MARIWLTISLMASCVLNTPVGSTNNTSEEGTQSLAMLERRVWGLRSPKMEWRFAFVRDVACDWVVMARVGRSWGWRNLGGNLGGVM